MATKQAWNDRRRFKNLLSSLNSQINFFKQDFERLEDFKQEVLDDPVRKAEMKVLIDEDPDWDMTTIQDKYLELKAIYDSL